jgi:ribA/ribD-fused uncharacterized protein
MTYVIPRFENEHFFLSNFYENPIFFDSPIGMLQFKTGEHAFQAAKYKAMDPEDQKKRIDYVKAVMDAPTASKAKYAGRSVKIDLAKWEEVKVEAMRDVVFNKFESPDMSAKLLSTGFAMLVEGNDWGDTFWGRVNGKGYNMLGVILMEVRGVWYWGGARDQFPRWMDLTGMSNHR